MTDSQHESGDKHPDRTGPIPPSSPSGRWGGPAAADPAFCGPAAAGQAGGSPWYGQPGPGTWPPPSPPPPGSGKTGLIIASVLGLVLVLGIGVVIGIVIGRDSGGQSAGGSATARHVPATYSLNGITNACDLVDPTPLTRWASTPTGTPEHQETRPAASDSGGLKCDVGYANSTTDEYSMNNARMSVEAEFTDGSAPPFYDHWKHADTVTRGAGAVFGAATGIGSQGYWYSAATGNLVTDMVYVVCVQDGNVSVRVQISLTREEGSPAVSRDDLDPIASAQVRRALDGLRDK